jgi:hypothetical protein
VWRWAAHRFDHRLRVLADLKFFNLALLLRFKLPFLRQLRSLRLRLAPPSSHPTPSHQRQIRRDEREARSRQLDVRNLDPAVAMNVVEMDGKYSRIPSAGGASADAIHGLDGIRVAELTALLTRVSAEKRESKPADRLASTT